MGYLPALIELVTDDERDVELPSLGAAGFRWEHRIRGEAGVVDVRWAVRDRLDFPTVPPGVSAPEVATIRALGPGSVEVVLRQRRRWEPDDRARAEHSICVVVRC